MRTQLSMRGGTVGPAVAQGQTPGRATGRQIAERTRRVLLVPGLDGDADLVMGVAPRLFAGLRVLPFDHLRDTVAGGLDGLAERALAVLDADPEGDAPAYVCGESFGGTVALTLARRHPERVRGLILLSTFGWYPAVATYASRLGMAFWRLAGDRVASLVFRLWRPLSVPGALGLRCPPEITRVYLGRPPLYLPGYRAKCGIALAFDARPWLGEITCPTFVLTGTRDPVVPVSAGLDLARRIPNARLYRLAGGHLVHIIRSDEAGARIDRWMHDLGRRPGSEEPGRSPNHRCEHATLVTPEWR